MKLKCLISILLLPFIVLAQEQLGLRLENYAGTSGIFFNPASNLTNPLNWDLNLVAAGSYFENNYFFIKNTNTLDLVRNRDNASFLLAEDVKGNEAPTTYILDFKDDDKKRFLSGNAFLAGPSVVFKIGKNHSVGFFSNGRFVTNSFDVPNALSYYKYDRKDNFDPFGVAPFKGAMMSWSELGVNYAVSIPTNAGYLGFGLNIKKLAGYEAAYLENKQAWIHTKMPNDSISAENGFGQYGLTTSNLKDSGFGAVKNGGGIGFDFGFLYVIQEYEDGYKWRFGASLLDIGSIKFDKNAQTHTIKNPNTFELYLRDFDDFDLLGEGEAFLQHFSEETLGDPLASLTGNSFKMPLPTAFSLQADYNIDDKVYLNGLFIHPIPTAAIGPQREAMLAFTPRYEQRWFSASLPISLLNWQKVQVGLAARLGLLVIGSDKIGSLFWKSDYSGTDIYVALKLSPFQLGWGLFDGGFGGSDKKRGSRKKVKCYDF